MGDQLREELDPHADELRKYSFPKENIHVIDQDSEEQEGVTENHTDEAPQKESVEEKEKRTPFETLLGESFEETHTHLEYIRAHLSDFFLFTPSGKIDSTPRAELMKYVEEIKDQKLILDVVRSMFAMADFMALLVERGIKTLDEIQEIGVDVVDHLSDQFESITTIAEDISGGSTEDTTLMKREIGRTLYHALQFLHQTHLGLVGDEIGVDERGETQEQLDQEYDAYDDTDETPRGEFEEDEEIVAQKPTVPIPTTVVIDETETEEDAQTLQEGKEYPYGFIEPLNETVVFVTKDATLAKDWETMQKAGFVKGEIHRESGTTILTAYERVLPWVGRLNLQKFFDFNLGHRAKHREALKHVERLDGGFYPEAIFLDESKIALSKFTEGDEAWQEYIQTSHYAMLKERYHLD